MRILLIIFFVTGITFTQDKDKSRSYIERTREMFEASYIERNPKELVTSWKIPFKTKDRFNLNTIKVISTFGAPRQSFLKGHIHTAIDVIPSQKDSLIFVFPMAHGVICSIHLRHPHKTIVVKHKLNDSTIIFTSYKHLQEIYVNNGMEVNQETKLARLYTRSEAKKQGGSYDHLHLEIRKSFQDFGCASWLTMTKQELNTYFFDPWEFMKVNLGKVIE